MGKVTEATKAIKCREEGHYSPNKGRVPLHLERSGRWSKRKGHGTERVCTRGSLVPTLEWLIKQIIKLCFRIPCCSDFVAQRPGHSSEQILEGWIDLWCLVPAGGCACSQVGEVFL